METHTILGEQILARVPLLQGEGLRDHPLAPRALGRQGYPDHLERDEILSARASSPSPTR